MASFRVEVTNTTRREIRGSPGNVRQMIFGEIQSLENDARPYSSKMMKSTKTTIVPAGLELRRIRVDRWRIVYVVEKEFSLVTVLAVRKRPPYQYDDLEELIKNL